MIKINRYLLLLYCLQSKLQNTYFGNSVHKNAIVSNYNILLMFEYQKGLKYFKELTQMYNLMYLQTVFNVKLKEKNINAISVLPRKMSKYILYKTRRKSFKSLKIKYFNEVIYLFVVNIFLKNSKNICKFIKKKLETVHFKEHRKYFLFFFRIIKQYIYGNFELLKINGLTMKFKGKLARGGNSRTKTMYFKIGKASQGDKMQCLNTNKWAMWTKTGSFSCMFQIFYR